MIVARWPLVALSDIAEIVTGTTPSTAEPPYYIGTVPFITPTELDQADPISRSRAYLSEDGVKQARLLPKDAVLVCCIGSLGKLGIAGVPLVTNQQINALIVNVSLADARYVLHACTLLKTTLNTMAPSTTVKIVNKSRFSELTIPLPPLEEQRRIAAILDKADALRQKRRAALLKIDSLALSLFIENFGDPINNPKGWPVLPLCEIGAVITGNTPSRTKPCYFGTAIEWIKSDNINNLHYYVTRATESLSNAGKAVARTAPPNSILVTCIAGTPSCIGNAAMVDREVAFNQQINALVPSQGNPHFLYALILAAKRKIQEASTNGMKGMVSKSRFERICLPFPPIILQENFANQATLLRDVQADNRASLLQFDILTSCLQHRAFRGEL